MIRQLGRLWRGEIPLGRAFWDYAIIYGSLANLATTAGAFAILAADGPPAAALAVFLLPIPYNMLAVVGVWRSADRYDGPSERARLAKVTVVAWALVASLA
jgi:hypothetical protein